MRTMAARGWLCLQTALLYLAFAVAHNHSGETETYHVSAGHLFLLRCHIGDSNATVTWSRGNQGNLSLPDTVEVRDGLLWFLPVQMSHNGSYTCEKRHETGLLRMKFWLSVSSEECPDTYESMPIPKGVSGSLPCKQTEIFTLNNTRSVRWMKDCRPVQRQGEPISVDDKGNIRLPGASERDAGKYTCLVDISLDGRKYTAARSIHLTIDNNTVFQGPLVVTPQHEVVKVKVGMKAELKCLAYTGFSEDLETMMYWTVDGTYTEDHEELSESWKYIKKRGKVYGLSTLSISKVRPQFLNVPIHCFIMSPAGENVGLAWLQEADHNAFYRSVALCLAVSLAILLLAAFFFLLKVDLILAHRNLLRHFSKHQVPGGKLYDAYVSFLHPDGQSSDDTASFALQILPEELEERYGYSLYIRGRDDCPGEAMHDVVASTLHQCRRLIIILSPDDKTKEETPLCDYHNQLCYEQKVGLYDALTQNDPRVILVEIDGPVDYSRLPESLRFIKRKQGALRWNKASPGTHKLTRLHSNRNFWKNLRYHMPAVPARRRHTII